MKQPKTIIFPLVLLLVSLIRLNAQDLIGKELTKSDDVSSLVESGIGLLFGAKSLEGDINKVTVVSDAHNTLLVTVIFEGFTNAWLKGSIINDNKTRIDDIASAPVQLIEGSTGTDVLFTLNESPGNDKFHSALLKLLVCKNEGDATGKVFMFHLDKEWKARGLSQEEVAYDFIREGEVINVVPTPIGSSANISDNGPGQLPKPTKTSRVIANDALYKAKIERRSMSMRHGIIQQPMAKSTSKTANAQPTGNDNIHARAAKKNPPTKSTQPIQNFNVQPVMMQPLQLGKEEIDKGAMGPGNAAISLWDEIRSDVNFDFGEAAVTNISTDIFPDKNEQSGYYYYFPASYNLKWDRDEFYKLKILYGSASGGATGQVNMFAQLTPGIGTLERTMIEALVKDYATDNDLKFEKLIPVPLAEAPRVDLSGQLSSLYNIPAEKVSTSVSGLFDPVDVAWPMDSKNADDLMVGLKEVDLNGSLRLIPQGEMPEINIPIRISLDDEQVLGRIELTKNSWRATDWKNEMPFPIKLKYIHALFLNKEEKGASVPFIYSWRLGEQEVPVLATVKLDGKGIPKVVDNKAHRIWVEYSVPPCLPCKDKVINELTGGTTNAREQKIEVVSYVKERTNAYVIEVKVRSKFADTKGKHIVEMPALKLEEDGESYFIGPLFVPEEKALEYEYRIKLVTDEEVLQSGWIYSSESSLYLNKKLVEDALGKFPGE